MRALSATPATPTPLSRRAAIEPATCVPCMSSASPSPFARRRRRRSHPRGEVPAGDVVDQAVRRRRPRRCPRSRPGCATPRGEVRMAHVHAGVDDGHGHRSRSGRPGPAGRGGDLRQGPLAAHLGVVGDRHRMHPHVELHRARGSHVGQQAARGREGDGLVQAVGPPSGHQGPHGLGVEGVAHLRPLGDVDARLHPHQHGGARRGRPGSRGPRAEPGGDAHGTGRAEGAAHARTGDRRPPCPVDVSSCYRQIGPRGRGPGAPRPPPRSAPQTERCAWKKARMASRPPSVAASAKRAARVGRSPIGDAHDLGVERVPAQLGQLDLDPHLGRGREVGPREQHTALAEVELVGLEEHPALAEVDGLGVDHGRPRRAPARAGSTSARRCARRSSCAVVSAMRLPVARITNRTRG